MAILEVGLWCPWQRWVSPLVVKESKVRFYQATELIKELLEASEEPNKPAVTPIENRRITPQPKESTRTVTLPSKFHTKSELTAEVSEKQTKFDFDLMSK